MTSPTQPETGAVMDADRWIEWHGGENPVPGQDVDVRYRSTYEHKGAPADALIWDHVDHAQSDIIAYRLARPTPEVPAQPEPYAEKSIITEYAESGIAQPEPGAGEGLEASYLLMKRGLYYRPNAMGYTGIRDKAGRYSHAEAIDHADEVSGVTAIKEDEAPLFSPKCFDDIARDYLTEAHTQAQAEVARLTAGTSKYLKPGETVVERLDRFNDEVLGLMKLLQGEKERAETIKWALNDAVSWNTENARLRDRNEARALSAEAALKLIAADGQPYRSGYCQTDISVDPALTAEEAQTLARKTLEGLLQ